MKLTIRYNRYFIILLAGNYTNMKKYEEAVSALEKSLNIYDRWDSKPFWVYTYAGLGYLYHKMVSIIKKKDYIKGRKRTSPVILS